MYSNSGPIILVEDNESDAEVARRAIKRSSPTRTLVVIGDGLSAAEMLLGTEGQPPCPRPRLIMIDINLPGLDGIELLTRIRIHPDLRSIAVVIVSSSSEERDIRKAYDRGCNSYVTKPIDIRALQSLYASVVNYWTQTNIGYPKPVG
jgi:CheY-like chemotaxis protein